MNTENLTETEIETILAVADEKLSARADEPVQFILKVPTAVSLISQLQLAFRHPANQGVTREMTEDIVRQLIDKIAPEGDEVHTILMLGFNPDLDVPTPGGEINCRNCKHTFPLVHAIVKGYCPNCREHICPACGCTTSAACAGGCFWLPSGICSTCGAVLNFS